MLAGYQGGHIKSVSLSGAVKDMFATVQHIKLYHSLKMS